MNEDMCKYCVGSSLRSLQISTGAGQPSILNFPFLERLNLRTIVFLAPEEPSQRLLDFIDDQDISLHHLGVSSLSTNAWDPISEEIVLEAAELILNSNNYPLMIMCNLGRHRTGSKDFNGGGGGTK